jgi:hypothetical protein
MAPGVQNNFVDQSQYQLLSIMRERPQLELERSLQQTWKAQGKNRFFEPETLLRPGQRLKASKPREAEGPPVQVCVLSLLE